MRPLELRMSGVRSYRTETTVDFSDLTLLAIIGATGSGKSSLLEAITYALYGTATWGGGNVKSLIADGALRMSVSLSFEADDERWLITRSAPRLASPPSSQELECLSDPGRPRIDGSADVKRRVEELIGLSYGEFKSCVLLPQGRFDQLLKSPPGDRVKILKGILGLTSLDDTCARAKALERVVQDRYDEIRDIRGTFLPDPRAMHEAAAARILELTPRREELSVLEDRVEALAEEGRRYRERADAATSAAGGLEALSDAGLLGRLRALEQLEGELIAAADEATAAATAADAHAREVTAAVETARRSGRDAVALTALRGSIDAAATQLRAIARDGAALEARRERLADDGEKLAAMQERASDLAVELDEQTEAETRCKDAAEDARETTRAVLTLIEEIVAARERLRVAEIEHVEASSSHEQARGHEQALRSRHDEAETAAMHTRDALEEARRADAAAHAAQGCGPGDGCPVCARPLPPDFVAPRSAGDIAALQAALVAAQQAERVALDARTRAESAVEAAAAAVDAAVTACSEAVAAWALLAESSLPGELDPATVAADETTIRLVSASLDHAGEQLRAATEARLATEREHHTIGAQIADARTMYKRLAREIDDAAGEVAGRAHEVGRVLGELPRWLGVAATAGVAELHACEERLDVLLREAGETERRAVDAAAAASERQKAASAAFARLQQEVRVPAAAEHAVVRALAAEIDRHGGDPVRAPAPACEGIADLIAWARRVVAGAERHIAALRAAAERDSRAGRDRDEERVALLLDAGFEGTSELREAVIDIMGAVRHATAERDAAAVQLKPVAVLDALASQAEQLRGGLRELAFQLGNGKFVGYVVAQRQRALLVLASGIFEDLTGGQYGFTEEFKIADRHTRTVRQPETLSGGETFLASLALALGLVELAGRSGGRLQALFLDEGFGSLDPDALDQALDELERRAGAGRLIAMISHVPAIAERIDHVLQVTKTPQGSSVRLLGEEERAALLHDDAVQLASVVDSA